MSNLRRPAPGEALPAPPADRDPLRQRPPAESALSKGIETAIFGIGCFWGPERKFWQAGEGVCVTVVGYAGGATPNPTYEETGTGRTGHAAPARRL